ncbi:hypothetical protein [Streptomyces chartreusis]
MLPRTFNTPDTRPAAEAPAPATEHTSGNGATESPQDHTPRLKRYVNE